MSTTVSLNGSNFSIPRTGDDSWSATGGVDDYLVALSTGVLQKAGGAFTLTAEVNFGASFGLKTLYYKSTGTNPGTTGVLRLANAESVVWRNAANGADLALKVNASDVLEFNGAPVVTLGLGAANTALVMNGAGTAYQWAALVNANISASAAIAYSKLALTGSIVNADVSASAAIAYSKLALTGSLVNADVSASAAIAYSKLALTGSIVNADISASAAIAYSKLALTGAIVNADVSASAAIARSKLAAGTASHVVINDGSGNFSSEAQLAGTRGGSGVSNAGTFTWGANNITFTTSGVTSLTLPTSGTVATLAGTEALTNKDIDGGTAANTRRITIPKDTLANLTALTRKQGTVVYDTTANALLVDDGSNLNAIGGGSGEKNYCTSPSSASGWTASGAGVTVATETTAGNLPRPNTTKTGFKVTGVSGSTAYAYFRFTLDPADYDKKLKVQFDMKPYSGYVASDFKVDVYSNTASNYAGTSARLALSTDSSSITALPNLTGTYRTTFDSPNSAAPYIEIRIGLNASSTQAVAFSDLICGPGTVSQGGIVSDWYTYTPTSTWVSNATHTGRWRRVGSNMELNIAITLSGAPTAASLRTISLPTGYTIDTAAVSVTGNSGQMQLGHFVLFDSSASDAYYGAMTQGSVNNTLQPLCYYNGASGTSLYDTASVVSNIIPVTMATGDIVNIVANIPIAEWAGAGTVNVVQNDVEYASNSSTADSSDTTSFAYGPSGSPLPVALSAIRSKRVRFTTPIQATDQLVIEVKNSNGTWSAHDWNEQGSFQFITQNTALYGMFMAPVNSTDVDVRFCRYARATGATYGAAGSDWSTEAASVPSWRLKKFSAGAAVGFGKAAPASAGIITSYAPTVRSSINSVSAAYTVLDNDGYKTIRCTTGASDVAITLPAAANNTGREITFVKVDSGAGYLNVTRAGSDTIGPGAETAISLAYIGNSITLISNGTTWDFVGPYFQSARQSCTFTFNGSGGSQATANDIQRVGDVVTVHIIASRATSGTSSTSYTATAALPAWARPTSGFIISGVLVRNSGSLSDVGTVSVNPSGDITLQRSITATAFTNATNCGFQEQFPFSFNIKR